MEVIGILVGLVILGIMIRQLPQMFRDAYGKKKP